ncbi:MAG TPA: FAD-dependent monooxygenase [Devosiaceae bacterium]|nr:FAD-dependent monooxygenase [Devosiaceae bacterium]
MSVRADVAVVGGGLSGTAAAVAAAAAGLTTVHFAPPAPPDRRTSALMLPSIAFLTEAGLIADAAAIGTPLAQIRIIDATRRLVRAGETLFEAGEFGFEAFGYNIANSALLKAFGVRVASFDNLTVVAAPAGGLAREAQRFSLEADGQRYSASVLVGADGRQSGVRAFAGIGARVHPFEQAALVADLSLERPLGQCSVEFHYENGPFTLVPAGGARANLVWIDRRGALDAARERAALEAAILEKTSRLFGAASVTAGPHIFDLASLTADSAAAPGIVLVGEAAHAFPPIGAQGLNIGLRDVAELGRLALAATPADADWATRLSAGYAAARRADVARTGLMVDTLFRSLISGLLPADLARSAGMMALRNIAPLRRTAFETGMGRR